MALKSTANRSAGLPFFSADRPASVMTIYATGTVVAVDEDAGALQVDWQRLESPRQWYFWTGVQALWLVHGDHARGRELLDLTFGDGEQNLEEYLRQPFWASRYAPWPQFTWVPFYTEFATLLLAHRDDRSALVAAVRELAGREDKLSYLVTDRDRDGNRVPIADIDPFTLMGAFNRGTTDANRLRVAEALGHALGVTAKPPADFDGLPLLNNQNSWFVRFSPHRGADDIDILWQVFGAALALADEDTPDRRTEFVAAYDAAQRISGVHWNLSQGLFWARPDTFMTLEGQSRPFLRERFGLADPVDGATYLRLLDELRSRFGGGNTSLTSFPLLSNAAWVRGRSNTHGASSLAVFVDWAMRMAETVDLEEIEHSYKRAAAAELRRARDLLLSGDPGWPAALREGLRTADNLLHFIFKSQVAQAAEAGPERWTNVFRAVWENPRPASLDTLQSALRERLGKATPGVVTSFGALLLLAADTEENAPYLTTRTEKWYRLTGFGGPENAESPADRYAAMLRFLDEFRREVEGRTGIAVSRLEAQGMAWATTEEHVPEEWDAESRRALLAFRGEEAGASRAWLVRPETVDFDAWIEREYVSLSASYIGGVEPGASLKEVTRAVERGYDQTDYPERDALAAAYHAFLSRMRVQDLVVTPAGDRLYVGRVVSGPSYADESAGDRLRRDVEWLNDVPADTSLSERLVTLLDSAGSVVDLSDVVDEIERLGQRDEDGLNGGVDIPRGPTARGLPPITEDFARKLHMPRAYLQELTDLLEARRQIVLFGPPGTGKTHLALHLAHHLVGPDHRSNVRLVQFHPSYAYEDFFEGFRPVLTDSGAAGFKLQPGPLRELASAATSAEGADSLFVLVIDEMNRANLAKVFGELYFLLEYRKQSVRLQYSPGKPFTLPTNLLIIGTMNTADRSIAMVDAAIRRRFAFVEMHPDEAPVRDLLATFLGVGGRSDSRVDLLKALNGAIGLEDRDLKIGPSYLMRPEAATEAGLARIWRYDILPLLEEHYYGRLDRSEVHRRFGLDSLRRHVAASVRDPE